MSDLTRSGVDLDVSSGRRAIQATLEAGETIAKGQAVFIKSDGKFWLSDGSADDGDNRFFGLAANAAAAGFPVTAFGLGSRWHYVASGLTPGAYYYISGTDGELSTTETTGGATPVAIAINATDILVIAAMSLSAAQLS